jgi:hypothetical protein
MLTDALLWLIGALMVAIGLLFGKNKWLQHKATRDAKDRNIAQADHIQRSQQRLEDTRRQYANQAPIDPAKRTEFEKP